MIDVLTVTVVIVSVIVGVTVVFSFVAVVSVIVSVTVDVRLEELGRGLGIADGTCWSHCDRSLCVRPHPVGVWELRNMAAVVAGGICVGSALAFAGQMLASALECVEVAPGGE